MVATCLQSVWSVNTTLMATTICHWCWPALNLYENNSMKPFHFFKNAKNLTLQIIFTHMSVILFNSFYMFRFSVGLAKTSIHPLPLIQYRIIGSSLSCWSVRAMVAQSIFRCENTNDTVSPALCYIRERTTYGVFPSPSHQVLAHTI